MEKNIDPTKRPEYSLKQRERKFGDKVIKKILAGDEAAVVNPRLLGLGGYRREEVYAYIQDHLSKVGVTTTLEVTPMESGSDAPIPRHTLVVSSRLDSNTDL